MSKVLKSIKNDADLSLAALVVSSGVTASILSYTSVAQHVPLGSTADIVGMVKAAKFYKVNQVW